jgi:hypothetical protein
MKKYKVEINAISQTIEAETENHALDLFCQDAGYKSYAHMVDQVPSSASETIEVNEIDEEFTAADQRIMIVIENGIIDTIFVEDELQTGNVPNIEIIDIDDQAYDSVTKPDPHIILTTTEKFEKIRWA